MGEEVLCAHAVVGGQLVGLFSIECVRIRYVGRLDDVLVEPLRLHVVHESGDVGAEGMSSAMNTPIISSTAVIEGKYSGLLTDWYAPTRASLKFHR